jgi:hypothetical protein
MDASNDLRETLLGLSKDEYDALLIAIDSEREISSTATSPPHEGIQATLQRSSTDISSASLESSSSFVSTAPSSSEETTVSSELVPVHGIGYLSGKLIQAVGTLELRGLEEIIIQVQLVKWGRYFPHPNSACGTALQDAYEGILDLIRHFHLFCKTDQ